MSYMQSARYGPSAAAVAAAASRSSTAGMPIRQMASQATCPIMVPNRALHEIVGRIHPQIRIEPSVEEVILELMNDFTEKVIERSCEMAKHRKTGDRLHNNDGDTTTITQVEQRDVQFALKNEYGVENIPQLGIVPSRKRKFSATATAMDMKRHNHLRLMQQKEG